MMKVSRNGLVLLALLVFVGIGLIFTAVPAPVSASVGLYDYSMNVNEHNGTGRAANDLEVQFEGNVMATGFWGGGIFTKFSYGYDSATNITTARWYGGTVAPCQTVHTCMMYPYKSGSKITYIYLPRWSYDGIPGPIVGAALSSDVREPKPGWTEMIFANTPKDGGPQTIGVIQIGVSNTIFTLPELVWSNEALNKIQWAVQKTNVPMKLGQSLTFGLPTPLTTEKPYGIVYRAKVWLDSDPKNVIEYIGQCVPKQ